MPTRLVDRCLPDSIREFRSAARQRYLDGLALASAGQRTAAIYLWGYTAEMLLKAAYFSLIGFLPSDTIKVYPDIKDAINNGKSLGIHWPPGSAGHNVRAWTELLILERAKTAATAYNSPFDHDLQRRGHRFQALWRETLRYHKNRAYFHELNQVREAAEWLLANSHRL